tara:strand:+ start:18153 stop:19220 length:1068 start_codon:yes stop_codon:yes gene_type:complete
MAVYNSWQIEQGDLVAERIANRVSDLGNTSTPTTIAAVLAKWRTEQLIANKVIAKRGKGKGRPISEKTKSDYKADCIQLEKQAVAKKAKLNSPTLLSDIRKLLAPWANQATHYNGLRNSLSRVFSWAVSVGDLTRNPIIDIEKAVEHKREVLIPDNHYIQITKELATHSFFGIERDGEWRAKICDLIYMLSQSPIDVFSFRDSQISDDTYIDDGIVYSGSITISRAKTAETVIIGMNSELRELVDWFRAFKKAQNMISPYLFVYPSYMGRRYHGKRVTHRTMSAYWLEARKAAQEKHGFNEDYQLRDLRKRGLTDEALTAGKATDKGAHATEAMRNHYVLTKPPKRHGNTLKPIR